MEMGSMRGQLATTLKTLRNSLGLTQEELAWRAGLHRSYVADIERGARNLSLGSIEKLAGALQVSVSTLFTKGPPGEPGGGQHTTGVEILFVEDAADDVDLTLRAFRKARMKNVIHVVRDGNEAIQFLANRAIVPAQGKQPSNLMVLLDLGLPRMSGLDVLRAMKADARLRNIPVIVLTGSQQKRDLEECRRLGVEFYINKPVDFQNFSSLTPHFSLNWTLTGPSAAAPA